jgi:hypothetical protein
MRVLAILLALTAAPAARAGEVTIDFDDVSSATVVDDHYATLGITFTGVGDGGPFEVMAKASCGVTSSPPNAVTVSNAGDCPEIIDSLGLVRAEFTTPQPRVSVMVTHLSAGTATYLRAFEDDQFLDWRFGRSGGAWVGVPQKIEIVRDVGEPWTTAVEFGAFYDSGMATFDDVHFAIGPVATQAQSWSTVKSRY